MMEPQIYQYYNVAVDLSRIKCMQVVATENAYNLSIGYNDRIEYVFHPGRKEWDKVTFNDVVNIEYRNFEAACSALGEWVEIWKLILP